MSVSTACMSVCQVYAGCQRRSNESIRSSRIGVTDGYEPPHGCWESNQDPLEEQPELLTTDPLLQPAVSSVCVLHSAFMINPHPGERSSLALSPPSPWLPTNQPRNHSSLLFFFFLNFLYCFYVNSLESQTVHNKSREMSLLPQTAVETGLNLVPGGIFKSYTIQSLHT